MTRTQRLTLHMEGASGLRLAIIYELGDNDFFLRRRLELTTKSPLPLRQIDVWLVGIDGKCSHQGFGSPVLLEDTFWGVEFPAAENRYAGGLASLSHFPGRTVSDRFTSKTAVLGVSEPGRAARWFQRYVETFRAPSSKTPLFVNYNTWWTLMPPTEKNSLELIELFRRKLYEPHGESIDTFTLAWPGPEQYSASSGAQLELRAADLGWEIAGQCRVEAPVGSKATMHVLCDPRGTRPGVIQCTATVGGKPVEVRAVRTPPKPEQSHGPHPWTWFEFPVPDGQSEVALAISPAEKTDFFRGEVGWWLWAEHPLQKRTLVVEYAGAIPKQSADLLPLPIGQHSQRVILTIQPPRLMRTRHRWPKDKPLVWLDEVEPDEAVQDYGKMEKNQSVWQKPMILAGKKFARGLGAHANGRILYELAGAGFKTFRCQVGRDDHADNGTVVFQVWADGNKRFDSGPMTKATPAKPVEVNVAGASTLELRALDGGDGISGDHANWVEAQLLR